MGATLTTVSGCWCAHNIARCAVADDGGAKAFPGVENPGSGSIRVPQRALKQGYMAVHFVCIWHLVGLDHEAVCRDRRGVGQYFLIFKGRFPLTIVPNLR